MLGRGEAVCRTKNGAPFRKLVNYPRKIGIDRRRVICQIDSCLEGPTKKRRLALRRAGLLQGGLIFVWTRLSRCLDPDPGQRDEKRSSHTTG